MKSIKRKDIARIMAALVPAHYAREKAEVSDIWWKAGVMGHIRNLTPFYSEAGYLEFFQQFLWRLAPVACVLAVALTFTIVKMDFFPDYELAKIFVSDPKDFMLLAMNNG
jgi:hypothetical protein